MHERTCRKCGAGPDQFKPKVVTDGGFEVTKIECRNCGETI